MKIAIASGKGGTGKTTVAVNLALSFADFNLQTVYCDCDVEAPNGHIFLKPTSLHKETVTVPVPRVNQELCDGCRKCAEICQFGAVVVIKGTVIIYPELCHGCGGCQLVCPQRAIEEIDRPVGEIETGEAGNIRYIGGRLNIGEVRAVPLIHKLKTKLAPDLVTVIDAPPGTSCPVIETLRGVDYVILVTEPTPFGLNDLILALETVHTLGIPCGVVINRSDIGDDAVEEYCDLHGVEILRKIPFSREIAEAYSRGNILVDTIPDQRRLYASFAGQLMGSVVGVANSRVIPVPPRENRIEP